MTRDAKRTVAIDECPSCHGKHNALSFARFTNMKQIGDHLFTHWTLCPATDKAVYLRFTSYDSVEVIAS